MHATQTQIDAFYGMSSEQRETTTERVLAVFAGDTTVTFTREEIAGHAKLKEQTVCGRVNELVKAGRLAPRGTARRPGKRCRQGLVGLPVEVVT